MSLGWIPLRIKIYFLVGLAFAAGVIGWRAQIAKNAVQREKNREAVRQAKAYRETRAEMDEVGEPPSVDAARGILREFSDD